MTTSPPANTRVDVVILHLNRAEMIIQAIESALAQHHITPHIWVIDQGSQPGPRQRLRAYVQGQAAITLIELDENIGVAAGRNLGMAQGNAPFIAVIDDDATYNQPDTLHRTLQHFQHDAQLAVCSARIINAYTLEDDYAYWAFPRRLFQQRTELFPATRFIGCGHVIRRRALDATDGYDDALFFYWEELDLAYQFVRLGYRVMYTPQLEVLHYSDLSASQRWQQDRFLYLVRNMLYVDWKYFREGRRWLMFAGGYLLKGMYNRKPWQTVRAIAAAVRMIRQAPPSDQWRFRAEDKAYVHRVDTAHRGSLWERARREVFEKLR
jgi:GT2 family glycosyltransferase